MRHKHHTWSIGSEPPLIRAHSLAKHRVIQAYLEEYISVLTANPRLDRFRLTLVDGFAGGGSYRDSQTKEFRPGSPLVMLNAMAAAETKAQQHRSKSFRLDVDYFFVEQNKSNVEYLKVVIQESPFRALLADKINILQSDFLETVPDILSFVKKRQRAGRAIFLLDQFGYSDVPLTTIKSILGSLDNAEVILTFAVDSMIDYLTDSPQSQQILERIGLDLSSHMIGEMKQEIEWRRKIQFCLHHEIPAKTSAGFYTPFFIRSHDAHRDYWLIHLSGHARARDVMVGLHWQQNTSFAHYGRSGLQMLGYDETSDASLNRQTLLPTFFFDETALASSQEALFDQLPERVHSYKDGVAFKDFFADVTNECPVTAQTMKLVLSELAAEGIIEVLDTDGQRKRAQKVREGAEIRRLSRQGRLCIRGGR